MNKAIENQINDMIGSWNITRLEAIKRMMIVHAKGTEASKARAVAKYHDAHNGLDGMDRSHASNLAYDMYSVLSSLVETDISAYGVGGMTYLKNEMAKVL